MRIWHIVPAVVEITTIWLFFLSGQCFRKNANVLAIEIVLMFQKEGLLKARHRHPSCSVSAKCTAC